MENCVFCQIIEGRHEAAKVYENEHVYAFLDNHPASEYHTLVVHKKHYQDIFETPEEALQQIMSALKKLTSLYRQKLGIKNIQIINNSGPEAQQHVFHLHFHIIPRRQGDGQDIKRHPQLQLLNKFEQMLEALK